MKGGKFDMGGFGGAMGMLPWLLAILIAIPAGLIALVIILFVGGYPQLALYVLIAIAVMFIVALAVRHTIGRLIEKQFVQAPSMMVNDLMEKMPDIMRNLMGGALDNVEPDVEKVDKPGRKGRDYNDDFKDEYR